MSDEKLANLERRVEALEKAPCKDGHSFVEATALCPEVVIYCNRCGETRQIGDAPRIGFAKVAEAQE